MTDTSPPGRASRREARERALELAYEARARSISFDELVASLIVAPERFAVELLASVDRSAAEIDSLISAKAKGWTLERMPVIDLLIMRLAVAELLHFDTPRGVVLSEAVELAAHYSTEESSRFVNGLLAAVAREVDINE